MKNILITGISGFVGTNLIRHFDDHRSIRLNGFSRTKVDGVEYLPELSAQTLNDFKINTVIHLAGIAHDLSGRYQRDDYYKVNYEGTKTIVDEVLKSTVEKFIFVSSIKAVCDTSSTPADEMLKPNPVSDYGKSKLMAEEDIQSKSWEGRSYFILRPGMMHGPGNKGNLNLLYQFVKWGLPFPLGAFHNQRSFLSIDNFCFVVEQLIEKQIESGIYHVADDGYLSTAALYRLIAETVRKQPRIWNLPKTFVESVATLVGKKSMLSKLTEDMIISNKKMISAMNTAMPIGLREGLVKTIHAFDGK